MNKSTSEYLKCKYIFLKHLNKLICAFNIFQIFRNFLKSRKNGHFNLALFFRFFFKIIHRVKDQIPKKLKINEIHPSERKSNHKENTSLVKLYNSEIISNTLTIFTLYNNYINEPNIYAQLFKVYSIFQKEKARYTMYFVLLNL